MAETTTKKRTYTKKTTTAAKAPAKEAIAEKQEPEVMNYPQVDGVTPTVVAEKPATQINMIVEEKAEPVIILYIDSVIPNNEIRIGRGRSIFGSGKKFAVQKTDFEGEFMTATIIDLIAARKLIILSGLNDEERKLYNCYYTENEVLRGEQMFDFFFDMDTEEAKEKFAMLCPEHQRLVATRFMDAYYEKHDNRVTRDKVEALNAVSKAADPEGLFTPIVKDINEKMA